MRQSELPRRITTHNKVLRAEISLFRAEHRTNGLALRRLVLVALSLGQTDVSMRQMPPLHEARPMQTAASLLRVLQGHIQPATKRNH